jgi:hypothetical protein
MNFIVNLGYSPSGFRNFTHQGPETQSNAEVATLTYRTG